MEYYLWMKWLHILSATIMFGTGLGTAFYMFVTNRSGNVQAMAVVSHWVVKAGMWFTTPAVIIQPLSGALMIYWAGFPLQSLWVWLSVLLYAIAGLCWLPVLWLQLKMRDMAQVAAQSDSALPVQYWRYEKIWTVLGFPAFIGLIAVYGLMVHKPF
ncbi:DUF2269 domain-containing protein [Chitinibacter sp. SCUT-21]|uniref:DUF2269 family protein n=1 Tax=Chitinibacter sp. SCUT-21 TaxID=2970891 RepID=UPI0035A667B7